MRGVLSCPTSSRAVVVIVLQVAGVALQAGIDRLGGGISSAQPGNQLARSYVCRVQVLQHRQPAEELSWLQCSVFEAGPADWVHQLNSRVYNCATCCSPEHLQKTSPQSAPCQSDLEQPCTVID